MSQNDEELYSMWCSKLDLARYRLLAINRQEGSQEVRRIGIVIDEEVSLEKYLKFSESEPKISVKCRLIGGKIEAYEIPIDPHALLQAKLIFIACNWNDQFLAVLGELDIIVGTRDIYRCDLCVRPINRPIPQGLRPVNSSGQPYPTLVVEIGDMESLKSLHNMVEGYFSARTTIQLYLAIKIFPRHRDNTFALIAMLYRRTDPNNQNHNPTIPVIVKSFGTANIHISSQNYLLNTINIPANIITGVGFGGVPCNAVNIQEYQMDIPTDLLFDGVNIPANTPANFNIDLFKLQNELARAI
ncbi:hypothetical protein C1645_824405 [Glomus cerebriforme]|uniref:Restriction endonuclease domain-containing protein n=1 Tax=Glomus cerebriforme TaxID=658196 RepID=A0A397SVK6_9GLOM|nr:hypothetical protein C1645_824405 [Glomus cerebriforme]